MGMGRGGGARVALRVGAVLSLTGGSLGCASSVIIQQGDAAFTRATGRIARTQEVVAAAGAPADEQTRFMQAEAFYRYRFAFPVRGIGAHLAQAGAEVAELTGPQALAAMAGPLW